ncbi:MAG: hypothetical protein ACN4G0_14055 [Polyangiales bacterium]
MRWMICACVLVALTGCKEEIYFIPGTGTLPDCDEAPVTDLNGTLWFDQGTVTIRTSGCLDAMPNDEFQSCALNWAFTQNGNDVEIVVDEEYRLEGRLCGDMLYLRGGWWLPVMDEDGFCYEDDSAAEAGIQAEGNVLMVSTADRQMTGTLALQAAGGCSADYEVTFQPVRDPSLN